MGVVLGTVGAAVGARELAAPTAWVAYVLAASLIVLACLGERWTLSVPGLGPWLQKALQHARALPPTWRGALLGLATPLLPCGLLWAACASAAVAGSPLGGGAVMTGFALGSLPLLLLAQTQLLVLTRRLGPRALLWISRGAMLLAAGMLVWRGIAVQQGGDCCH